MGEYSDTITLAEFIAIGVSGLLLLLQLAVALVILANRDYAPFKAKQVDLIFLSVISSFFWSIGLLQSLKFIPEFSLFSYCSIWHLWCQMALGNYMWACVINLRFWKLYVLFKLKKKLPAWKLNMFFLIQWIPALAICAAGTALSSHVFYTDESIPSNCVMLNAFLYALYAYMIVLLLVSLFFTISLRDLAHRAFNEFQSTRAIFLLGLLFAIPFTVLVATDQSRFVWGRIVAYFMVAGVIHTNFWVLITYPFYKWVTQRQQYEKLFRDQINTDSMAAVKRTTQSLEPLRPVV